MTIVRKMMEIKTQNTSYFIITMDKKKNDVLSKIGCYVKMYKMKVYKRSIDIII